MELNAAEVAFLLEGVDWQRLKRHKRFSLERAGAHHTPPLEI